MSSVDPEFSFRISSTPTASCLATIHSNESCVFVGTLDAQCMQYDLNSKKQVDVVNDLPREAAHTACSIQSIGVWQEEYIWTHFRSWKIVFYKISTTGRLPLVTIPVSHAGFCPALVFGNFLAYASSVPGTESIVISRLVLNPKLDPELTIQQVSAIELVKELGMPSRLQFISEGQLLAGFESGEIVMWSNHHSANFMLLSKLKVHADPVMSFDYHVGKNVGISASADETVKFWTICDDNIVLGTKSLALPNPGVSVVAIRADGKLFATGGWDARIRLFSMKTSTPLAVLNFHRESIMCLTFAPKSFTSNHVMLTGSRDGVLAVWDLYSSNKPA